MSDPTVPVENPVQNQAQPAQQDQTPSSKPKKMKKWPDDPRALVSYTQLISPLKAILDQGYRLIRKPQAGFEYAGHNIGKQEQKIHANPKAQLTQKHLAANQQKGVHLIDVVLNIAFLLGIEQGRRSERKDQATYDQLVSTLETYRETNSDLRRQIDTLKATLSVKETHPNASPEEAEKLISDIVDAGRAQRIEAAKKELLSDPNHGRTTNVEPVKARFDELIDLANTLTKDVCSMADWFGILKSHGWTSTEWLARCTKKNIKTNYN